MVRDGSRQDYLAKAEEAERLAAQATDVVERSSLRRQANNYRQLAKFIERNCAQRPFGQSLSWANPSWRSHASSLAPSEGQDWAFVI